jgi:hypothetical protein
MAFCLGVITAEEKADLETIGEIRNLFAHRIHRSAFTNSRIAALCRQLALGSRFVARPEEASPRELFNVTVSALAYNLGNTKLLLRNRRLVPVFGTDAPEGTVAA